MLLKQINRHFSLEILSHLSFTDKFYQAVQTRLLPKNKFLVLDVKPGSGCGGFTYEFTPALNRPDGNYLVLEREGRPMFAVDKDSLMFLEGAIIDFEEDVHKTSFVVKENPNVELTCSCKRSFSPKSTVY